MMRWLLVCLVVLTGAPAWSCGRDTDCDVPSGTYRIAMPDGDVTGVILFFHGYQGTAAGFMKSSGTVRQALSRGIAVVAPQGLGKSWSFPGAPRDRRNESAFIDQVHADLKTRFDLPMDRIMVTGFSIGGTMAWHAACHRGTLFAGFAPVAGAYWNPLPETCPSPAPVLIHVHGTSDRTVPMTGRPIGPRAHQGDVLKSIAQWRRQGQCSAQSTSQSVGRLTCERWSDCGQGVIELCLHDGGHSIRGEWVLRAWDELVKIKGWT